MKTCFSTVFGRVLCPDLFPDFLAEVPRLPWAHENRQPLVGGRPRTDEWVCRHLNKKTLTTLTAELVRKVW
jgi:hypothetical protein